ncbi:sugar phosphate isomerase/epimerase family protein [Thermus altitudinis]|uniref:sugar phosphate isomerase/epimerase family protein n=1 Tax=Thermus altitudinis TaxID=2908145 RepID=UPI001FAAD3CF|nr:sugar phosphate isomerase/epimerase family protein [Thermus altitudinis]
MDVRVALSVAQAVQGVEALEEQGVGLEVYLDPAHLLDDGLFQRLRERVAYPLSVHLPFWNLDLLSPDPEIRTLTLRRLLFGLERAAELGADRAVFHSGIPHGRTPQEALERASRLAEALKPVVRRASLLGVELFLENSHEPGPEGIGPLLEAFPELGFCFDAAHARVFSQTPEPAPWLALEPEHLHLNDTDGVYDGHRQLGEGVLDHGAWLPPFLNRTLVLEVRGDPSPSLAWLRALGEAAPRPPLAPRP